MYDFFGQNIEFLKGVGPQRARILASEANIHTYGDLLNYFPFRYIDKSNYKTVRQINNDKEYVVIKGRINQLEEIGVGRKKRLCAYLQDETGSIKLQWFSGISWIKKQVYPGIWLSVFGKPNLFRNEYSLNHPEIETLTEDIMNEADRLTPIYSTTEKMKTVGLTAKSMGKITRQLVKQAQGSIPEILPEYIIKHFGFISREQAFCHIHHPQSNDWRTQADKRMRFEELFLLQLDILRAKAKNRQHRGFVFEQIGDYFRYFYQHQLPFRLTKAQERVIKEIRQDTKTAYQMNRLLQGDVGSGKTIVILMSMLIALDNGFQSCMMAPTEILAQQHYQSFLKLLKGMDIRVGFLSGSVKKKERALLLQDLAQGKIDMLIGTHALIEESVVFKNLGFVVIDEQHRFGVAQRARLWEKNTLAPHVLVSTATPIPRTLGMSLYGDLDVSIIDELPPNRKSIQTTHATDRDRLKIFAFLRQQINMGRQVYVVYPLIKESEKLDLKDLMDGYESLSREFPLPEYALSIVHGKMKPDVKEYEMDRFKKGQTQIMVSTTVIEVGVDVPNASVMVIENSERFGLAQLHQLRGRVGRGAEQSYCILVSADHLSPDALARIQTMVESNDGFAIAEADLRLRGPGNLQGTRQSGLLELNLADIVEDEFLLKLARETVVGLLKADPELQLPEHRCLSVFLENRKNKSFWAKIS